MFSKLKHVNEVNNSFRCLTQHHLFRNPCSIEIILLPHSMFLFCMTDMPDDLMTLHACCYDTFLMSKDKIIVMIISPLYRSAIL